MSTLAEIEAAVVSLTSGERERLESLLRDLRASQQAEHLQELYRRTGVHPLPKRGGPPVTMELVRQICEEEGI